MDTKIQLAIKEKIVMDGLDLTTYPPFTKRIINYEWPLKFRPPTLDLYDKTKDPVNHVQSFKSHIFFVGTLNEMMCRSFPLTFRNITWN